MGIIAVVIISFIVVVIILLVIRAISCYFDYSSNDFYYSYHLQVIPSIAMVETYVRLLLIAPHSLFRPHFTVITKAWSYLHILRVNVLI